MTDGTTIGYTDLHVGGGSDPISRLNVFIYLNNLVLQKMFPHTILSKKLKHDHTSAFRLM